MHRDFVATLYMDRVFSNVSYDLHRDVNSSGPISFAAVVTRIATYQASIWASFFVGFRLDFSDAILLNWFVWISSRFLFWKENFFQIFVIRIKFRHRYCNVHHSLEQLLSHRP
jgi:hypothetical protein